jgi:acetyltransferase
MIDLNKMFKPESVAVIGASNTPGKVGYIIVDNLINDGFEGAIYPVNPKGGEILGKKAYANIKNIPEKVDLAIITIPVAFVNPTVKECGEAGVENMVVITAGFKEVGEEGAKLREEDAKLRGDKYVSYEQVIEIYHIIRSSPIDDNNRPGFRLIQKELNTKLNK